MNSVGIGDLKISELAKQYLSQVIKKGRLSYGPFSRKFEEEFAGLHGCRFGIFLNSGTSALHISLQALKEKYGWNDGDEVIVPAVTFVSTPNIVLHNRMKPVFVDVNRRTYNIDPQQVFDKCSPKTRAVIPVHLLGLPAAMQDIHDVAYLKGLKTIEDSCESMFNSVNNRKVGSWGEIGCFSTYISHFLVSGVGGICTTNDEWLAIKLRSLMNHGRDSIYFSIDDDDGLKGEKLKQVVDGRFKFESVGHSFRATEFEAALALAQLKDWRSIVNGHKINAGLYTRGLRGLENKGILQLPYQHSQNNYMFYPVVVCGNERDELMLFLEQNKIETRGLMPLMNQPIYKDYFKEKENYPVASYLLDHGFCIGCHQNLSSRQAVFVVDVFAKFYKKYNGS